MTDVKEYRRRADELEREVEGLKAALKFKQGIIDDLSAEVALLEELREEDRLRYP